MPFENLTLFYYHLNTHTHTNAWKTQTGPTNKVTMNELNTRTRLSILWSKFNAVKYRNGSKRNSILLNCELNNILIWGIDFIAYRIAILHCNYVQNTRQNNVNNFICAFIEFGRIPMLLPPPPKPPIYVHFVHNVNWNLELLMLQNSWNCIKKNKNKIK